MDGSQRAIKKFGPYDLTSSYRLRFLSAQVTSTLWCRSKMSWSTADIWSRSPLAAAKGYDLRIRAAVGAAFYWPFSLDMSDGCV
jgi:hypothetical protein